MGILIVLFVGKIRPPGRRAAGVAAGFLHCHPEPSAKDLLPIPSHRSFPPLRSVQEDTNKSKKPSCLSRHPGNTASSVSKKKVPLFKGGFRGIVCTRRHCRLLKPRGRNAPQRLYLLSHTKKPSCPSRQLGFKRRLPTLPRDNRSTIGVSELNFSVRNGKRWILTAITT